MRNFAAQHADVYYFKVLQSVTSIMAVVWKRVFAVVGLVGLCFFGIPIKVDKNTKIQKEELFREFLQRFNKTYCANETEYTKRYNNFKV
jgi:hypothetical protein